MAGLLDIFWMIFQGAGAIVAFGVITSISYWVYTSGQIAFPGAPPAPR